MFENKAHRNWTITALVLFAVSFVAISWISRRPLCLDSRIVEKVERIENKQSIALYRCNARRTVAYDDVLMADLYPLSRRLYVVEKFLENSSPFRKPVTLKILEAGNQHFRIIDSEIQISRDLFNAPGYLEKGIVKVWIDEQIPFQNTIYEESLSDLVLFVMTGGLEFGELDLAQSGEFFDSKWPFVAKGLKGYCSSDWKTLEHMWFCSQEIKLQSRIFVSMSVRPLLSGALIESYMALRLKERSQLLDLLPAIIQNFNAHASGKGYSAFETSEQNLVDLSSEISAFLQSLQGLESEIPLVATWTQKVKKNLEIKGFTNEPLEAQVDILLHVAQKNPGPLIEAVSHTKKKGLIVLASTDEDYFFLPGLERIPKKAIRHVRAQRVLYWTCETPTLSELMKFAGTTTRLLLIQDCKQKPTLSLASSFLKGIQSFVLENPTVAFVDLHLPSLHFAIENEKLQPTSKLIIASLNSAEMQQVLQKQLGWKGQNFDKNSNFYEVQSDIEAIKAFRP